MKVLRFLCVFEEFLERCVQPPSTASNCFQQHARQSATAHNWQNTTESGGSYANESRCKSHDPLTSGTARRHCGSRAHARRPNDSEREQQVLETARAKKEKQIEKLVQTLESLIICLVYDGRPLALNTVQWTAFWTLRLNTTERHSDTLNFGVCASRPSSAKLLSLPIERRLIGAHCSPSGRQIPNSEAPIEFSFLVHPLRCSEHTQLSRTAIRTGLPIEAHRNLRKGWRRTALYN